MRTDFCKEEHIESNLVALDSLLGTEALKVEDYLKIAMLVSIYDTLQEIKEELIEKF
jgi:hypothetical protein